jgi:hypothetical protein
MISMLAVTALLAASPSFEQVQPRPPPAWAEVADHRPRRWVEWPYGISGSLGLLTLAAGAMTVAIADTPCDSLFCFGRVSRDAGLGLLAAGSTLLGSTLVLAIITAIHNHGLPED